MSDQTASDSRRAPRLRVPAMYTLLRARPEGERRYRWTGYIYDVSESGMRFELDAPVDAGSKIEIRAMLPGSDHTTFKAMGTVIRLHDDPEEQHAGPVRMAMTFDEFITDHDRRRVRGYLEHSGLRLAA